jgi:prepilin-type processing-associated H-X9-DG protein
LNEYGYGYWHRILVLTELISFEVTLCPSKKPEYSKMAIVYSGYSSDYGLNESVFGDKWIRWSDIHSPSKMYMYGEKNKYWNTSINRWQPAPSPSFVSYAVDKEAHFDGLNIAFADGHVARLNGILASKKDYLYLPWYNATQTKP